MTSQPYSVAFKLQPISSNFSMISLSFIFVSAFQVYLFWQGVDLVKRFLNFAGPAVYVVMVLLMIVIWFKAGGGLLSEVGNIFSGGERSGGFEGLGSFGAFLAVFSIMVGYFAAVVINLLAKSSILFLILFFLISQLDEPSLSKILFSKPSAILDNKLIFSTGTKSLSPPEYSIFKQS